MLHTIYASQAPEAAKRLDRIAKKAAKYNVPFSYTVSEEHPQKVAVKAIGPDCRTAETIHTYTVAAVDIDINCENFIRANGWTVCAKIEHGDKGNIVTPYGFEQVDKSWYTVPARCDHCGTKRARAVTFMCRHEDGQVRQVGSSCLKDYTGIAPSMAILFAEITDIFPSTMDCTEDEFAARGGVKMYDVAEVLALACDAVKANGYIKSDYPNSTRSQVAERIKSHTEATEASKDKSKNIIDWLNHLLDDNPDFIGIERDCVALAKSGWTKMHHFGRLAFMPVAYDRYIERKQAEKQKEAAAAAVRSSSDFVGNVGERITIQAVAAKLVTSWDTQFGTTYLYKFADAAGNVYVWYASRSIELNDSMTLVGTVKDHTTYDGIKQTVLTRCKAA